MSTAYELLPTTGDESLDRDINTINQLIESHVSTLSTLGLDDEQIKSALEGRYGSAMQEAVEGFQSDDSEFVAVVNNAREIFENLASGTKRNRELAAQINRQSEIRRNLIDRISKVVERAEG